MLRAIIVLTEVQIHSASENTHFSSAKSNIKIPPQKIKKALKNQGFSGRYLFYRLLMAYPKGRRTQCAYSPRKRFALTSKLPMQLAFVALRAAKLRLPPQAVKEKAPQTGCFFFGLPERIRTFDLQSRSLTRYPAVPRVEMEQSYYSTASSALQGFFVKILRHGSTLCRRAHHYDLPCQLPRHSKSLALQLHHRKLGTCHHQL